MKSLPIKTITDLDRINKLKSDFKSNIEKIEKSKKSAFFNAVYEEEELFWFFSALNFFVSLGLAVFVNGGIMTLITLFFCISSYFVLNKMNFTKKAEKINFPYARIYRLISNKKISENNVDLLNSYIDSLNKEDKDLLINILEEDSRLNYEIEDTSFNILRKKLKSLSIQDIRDNKNYIFSFIENHVSEHKNQSILLDYMEERLKELTVSERVSKINNSYNNLDNEEKININNKKVIQSI